MTSTEPYHPPDYLVSISGLTAAQLTEQFQAFESSIGFVSSTPEIIFERLVANLYTVTGSTTRASEESTHSGEKELQSKLKWLQKNLTVLALSPLRCPYSTVNTVDAAYSAIPPTPIKFIFVAGDFGVGTRIDQYDSDDGNYGAGCRWSDFQHEDSQVQSGILNTIDWPKSPGVIWLYSVDFPYRLTEKPKVIVWLTGVDMRCRRPCSVEVEVIHVYEDRFNLRMKLSEENTCHSVGVSWVAFPSSSTRYSSSTVYKAVYGNSHREGKHISGLDNSRRSLLAINKYGRSSEGSISIALQQVCLPTPQTVRWDVVVAKDSAVMCELGIVCICST